MDLVEALGADESMVCAVGAGGKKTTLYALAARIGRAAVTATIRIPIFDRRVADVAVTPDPIFAVENATRWPIGVVPERERDDRYQGYDPEAVASLVNSGAAETMLVKADGPRARQFKAPNDREPQIPGTRPSYSPS